VLAKKATTKKSSKAQCCGKCKKWKSQTKNEDVSDINRWSAIGKCQIHKVDPFGIKLLFYWKTPACDDYSFNKNHLTIKGLPNNKDHE
jgi:hypothetical protein